MGSFMLWVLWFLWQSCSHTLQVLGVPLQDIEATCRLHGTSVCRWWQSRLEPAPAFMEPTSPRKPSRRWSSWHQEFLFRIQRGKLLPSSVRRHARRYTKAVQQYDRTTLQHQVVSIITGVSLKGLIPLLLLTLTCLLGQAAATPDLLQGIHLLTNSLAAWELAQLNKANFASAADYHDLARHTAGELRTAAAAHRFFNHHAMPAGASGFPTYPGAIDPLQLDDLLPEGQQFSANKDSYEADPEHKWSYGQHPLMSPEQKQRLKKMLLRNKDAFAYSMKELPGYQGEPVSVKLVHDRPIVSKPRQYSKLEGDIRDEKCQELLDAGFIEPADLRNPYASCPTMPAKKNELGEWRERRFRGGLPANQRGYLYPALQSGPTRRAVSTGGRQTLPVLH